LLNLLTGGRADLADLDITTTAESAASLDSVYDVCQQLVRRSIDTLKGALHYSLNTCWNLINTCVKPCYFYSRN
jgi:hypothetical protein